MLLDGGKVSYFVSGAATRFIRHIYEVARSGFDLPTSNTRIDIRLGARTVGPAQQNGRPGRQLTAAILVSGC
jgi:hypothetical protein